MVAERRERKAAPTTWVPPEPAGKGKAVGRKRAPAKKKTAVSVRSAGSVAPPGVAGAVLPPVAAAAAVAVAEQDDDQDMQLREEAHGEQGEETVQQLEDVARPALKGGAGPVETDTGEQLFCICLGVDNGTPMIFCEACENWFHFECINLSEEDASRIATYYCDMCEQAGSGKTEWSYDAPSTFDELPSFPTEGPASSPPRPTLPLPISSTSQVPAPLPLPPVMTPSDSGEEHDNADDGDYFTSKTEGNDAVTASSSRKVRKSPVSGDEEEHDDNDDDDEYDDQGTSTNLSPAKRKKKDSSIVGTSKLPALPKGNQRRKSLSAGTSNAKRRKRVVEDEDEAEERRRKAASSTNQFYGSAARPPSNPSDPLSNPTRKHCIEQLQKILEAIFTAAAATSTNSTEADASPSTTTSTVPPSKAREYAEAVERELFTHNSEPDPKGNLTHSKKYTAKFRTLHFNLKSNEYFRSRVASGLLDANAIYNMNQEDLLSPEVRAEQEAEKARSLAQSVKIDLEKPKTKITHKGEEILDEFDNNNGSSAGGATGASYDNASNASDRVTGDYVRTLERRESLGSAMGGGGDTPYLSNEGFDSYKQRERSMSLAGSPRLEHSPRFGSPSVNTSPFFTESPSGRGYSPVVESTHASTSASPEKLPTAEQDRSFAGNEEKEEFARPALPHHARSDSLSKAKLDLDAVWSTLQPAKASASPEKEGSAEGSTAPAQAKEKEEDDMDVESDDDDGKSSKDEKASEEKEEYDPFEANSSNRRNADDDFDALMGGGEASQESKIEIQPGATQGVTSSPSANTADVIAALPSVWEGIISLVDEGSFPARLVQVGGTPFGPHPSIWDRILPKGKIEITGRIDEKAASEYVVQSNFSHSRENVVLAILPNSPTHSSTSSEGANSSESMEKAEAMYAKLIAMYSERKRYGVAPPPAELKKVTRDHYIVPLMKSAPLPDYVEILDSHVIPEKGSRKKDYLLSVLVLQKGLGLNTTHRTASNSGGNTPQSSQDRSASTQSHLHPPVVPSSTRLSPLGQSGIINQATPFTSHMSPPYLAPSNPLPIQAQPVAAGLPSLDPAALQSLLSNPSLLQALNAGGQQGSPPHPSGAQYGAFSPPPGSMTNAGGFAGGIPGLAGGPPPPNAMHSWGAPQLQPQHQPYPPFPPPLGHWNPAGSPPWTGQQPAHNQQTWGPPAGQQHPPGYIDPERIKAASAEARMIAERDRQEKARRGGDGPGGSSYGPTPGRGGNRDRNDHRGGGRDRNDSRGFSDDRSGRGGGRGGGGRNNGPAGRKNDGGLNQMQAGIQDRGWSRRG